MKKTLLVIAIFFGLIAANGQNKMTVTFNDGTQKTDVYSIRTGTFSNSSSSTKLVSRNPTVKIPLEDFASVVVYDQDKELQYVVIDVKTNFNDKKSEKKLGLLMYSGSKMSVYYVAETISTGGSFGVSFNSDSFETCVKKNKEDIAYNMGYIYGAGPRGIKKRVRDYFADCPELIEKVDNDSIEKTKTIEMVEFYEKNCGL